ncbi:hypothetical protein [Humidisolicoccus flavus]|uniref:hypothetical protein n=1 Tax=Humidisolicoccus flavus TaxID=3111414 RepID=UPI0032519E83
MPRPEHEKTTKSKAFGVAFTVALATGLLSLVLISVNGIYRQQFSDFSFGRGDARYDSTGGLFILEWIPAWVSIVVCGIVLACAIVCVATADGRDLPGLINLAMLSGIFCAFLNLIAATLFQHADGIIVSWYEGGIRLGFHWIGSLLAVVASIILIIRAITLNDEYKRLRNARAL